MQQGIFTVAGAVLIIPAAKLNRPAGTSGRDRNIAHGRSVRLSGDCSKIRQTVLIRPGHKKAPPSGAGAPVGTCTPDGSAGPGRAKY
ncbi:hypothetical protein A6M21_01730 [Desulfotomaculum copahuensis]|uniref:Uncharacterized protein n=1 Tax=Desulfotomaculum copahuensis TaxID=1838280 RepID=A0A1B7LKH9_9FIRM|nr:hypothetical protein A6M21_01730 [Desulfotomaculum copahuensis]